MKTTIIQAFRALGKRVTAHSARLGVMAVIMLAMSSNAVWATHPGGDYTLVTSASSLSEGAAVILYDDVNNVGVTGSSGTSASYSATEDDWIQYTVEKPNGSTLKLKDWSMLISPYVYAVEDGNKYKFTYSTSESSSFTIDSDGHLKIGSTRLAHFGDYIRFYASSGTALKVYQVGHPKVYEEVCDGNLCINPDKLAMAGEYDGVSDAEIYSSLFAVTTQYNNKNHYVYVECAESDLSFAIYDYDYDEAFASEGHFKPTSSSESYRLMIKCWASTTGTFSATLHVYAYKVDGTNDKHVSIPVTITVLEKEQDCTPRTLNFTYGTSDKTIYKADGTTYTNAATPSAGAGYGTVGYSVVADPLGCASVNSSGVVTFTNYGTATITASLGANGAYCAAADISYNVTMECKARTLSFASSTPSVSVTTNSYTQTATKSDGAGTISYSMTQTSGTGFIIDDGTGEVTFNGHAGTATITATIPADDAGGYCSANTSYTLTVTPVVPTVSNFTAASAETSITLNGSAVTNNGGSTITDYGYIYSTSASTAGTLIVGGAGVTKAQVAGADIAINTAFAEKVITGLSSGGTYYVRAYATNAAGTGYSEIQTVRTVTYSDYQFSCAELTLTPVLVTASTPIFITSTSGKTVRSQDYITITGNGLSGDETLTFPNLPSCFAIKTASNGTISTNADGTISVDAYIFYTPGSAEADLVDGLNKITGITVAVGGSKPKQATLTQDIIGRHLPADFVIAAKSGNKWYALPADMKGKGNPTPAEIAVDDINNPTVAYTAASNKYFLNVNNTPPYVQFGMTNNKNDNDKSYALWANNSSGSTDIGQESGLAENTTLGANYRWLLTQTNTSISNPQDAKYTVSNPNNDNPLKLWMTASGGPKWGLYAPNTAIAELRLIPASDIVFAEAEIVEWGQHGAIIEVNTTVKTGVVANKVVANLNGSASAKKDLVQTGTSVKNTATKYNYTVDFGEGIDFAATASAGAMLTLDWYNGESLVAKSNIMVPRIIATSATMSDIESRDTYWTSQNGPSDDVHVLPGAILTANAGSFSSGDVTIRNLDIYPGATVKVTTGTLDVTNLVLRNGWTRVGSKSYDVARLYVQAPVPAEDIAGANLTHSNAYADWYIDFDQYYPIAVPWPVTVANMSYKNTNGAVSVGPGNSNTVRLRYYDGNSRATNVQTGVGDGANWKQYGVDGCKTVPTTLEPSHGYAMTARRPTGKAFSIIRMPLTFTNAWGALGEQGSVDETHKDTVKVTAYGVKPESKTVYAEGWNFIANPYMSIYQGAITLTPEEGDATTINVVNIPDVDFKEYGQYATATTKLKPSSGFLIQTPATGTITFGTANRKVSAPSYRREVQEEMRPEQQAYILLSNEDAEDMMGLFVSEKYTAEYDLNGDMEKFLSDGTSLRTYMHYGEMKLAYVALTETLAQEWIPVSVRIPSTGEYTFSMHEASTAGELEGVYLFDYANGDKITNLIEENYTFEALSGTIENRFAINAKVGERQTPTGVDAVSGGEINPNEPIKFLYKENVFILYQGVIYDAVGKKVKEVK